MTREKERPGGSNLSALNVCGTGKDTIYTNDYFPDTVATGAARGFGATVPSCDSRVRRGLYSARLPPLLPIPSTTLEVSMAGRTEPLSIESLLQKQREEKEAAAKASPVVLSCLSLGTDRRRYLA